jgi:mRNA interferase RelE/StbE
VADPPKYHVDLSSDAAEYLRSVDGSIRSNIHKTLKKLKDSPETIGKSLSGELQDYRSVRAYGRYRIVFRVTAAYEAEPEVKQGAVDVPVIGIRRAGDKQDVYAVATRILGNPGQTA